MSDGTARFFFQRILISDLGGVNSFLPTIKLEPELKSTANLTLMILALLKNYLELRARLVIFFN